MEDLVLEKLHRGSPKNKLRSEAPLPPTTHVETWVNRAYISGTQMENALSFRTRFYIDATGEQRQESSKVQMVVKVSKLGLSDLEEKRLIAVALPNYTHKKREFRFSCNRYLELGRNKDELRQRMALLLADAKQNAEAHAQIPDSELPIAVRSRPWLPRDKRAILNRPKRKLNKGSPG